ncbi:MAG: riboflavin synthase [Saprospiraceae bacterium]
MFTGIVEVIGMVEKISWSGTNRILTISSSISDELQVDQSISHNGVCLTVESLQKGCHTLTAIKETLDKTTLYHWEIGNYINLERCMRLGDRLDGHIVQGHVDDVATCTAKKDLHGSWLYTFAYNNRHKGLLIEKGSITINGTSLTLVSCNDETFQVAIIPYTYNNTVFQYTDIGTVVNVEFDILGKYILKSILK